MEERLIRPSRAAQILDCSTRTVYRYIQEGYLKTWSISPGKRGLRILKSSLDEFIERHQDK